jgi:hypothetical protein
MLASFQLLAQVQGRERPMERPTFYRRIQLDRLSIFYREAGPKNALTVLVLQWTCVFRPMFEHLFARLSDRYHPVTPDYRGF